MSAISSTRLAMLTVETISDLRNSESFDALYDLCLKEIQKIEFVEEPVLKRKRKEPKYSLQHYLEGNESRSKEHQPTTPRDHYRKQFYQAFSVLISFVRDRFDQPSFFVFEKQIGHFHDLLKEMRLLENPEKKFLVNVCKICRIFAVNPASSATAEQTFSLARRVKTWMRSRMLPTRFNTVSILNFHKDRTVKLDLIKIAKAFVQSDDNRMQIFGQFTKNDLPLIYLFCFYFSIGDFWQYHILVTLQIRSFISTNSCFMKVSFSQSRGPNFKKFSTSVGPNHDGTSLDTK